MHCIGRRDSQDFLPILSQFQVSMCVTLLYRPQVEQSGLRPKLINCLNLCQKYKRGRLMDRCDWVAIGGASSSWIEIPRNESGASQRWAGGDWTADYWDRGKQPRFWTLPIIDTKVLDTSGNFHNLVSHSGSEKYQIS